MNVPKERTSSFIAEGSYNNAATTLQTPMVNDRSMTVNERSFTTPVDIVNTSNTGFQNYSNYGQWNLPEEITLDKWDH